MADNGDVLLAIGRLQASVDHMRADFSEEKKSAATSRKAIYERHEELKEEMSSMRSDMEVAALISAQGREEVKALAGKIDANRDAIQPSIDDWKRIKTLGVGITGVLAIGGMSIGAFLMMGIDAFKAAMRQWFGG